LGKNKKKTETSEQEWGKAAPTQYRPAGSAKKIGPKRLQPRSMLNQRSRKYSTMEESLIEGEIGRKKQESGVGKWNNQLHHPKQGKGDE